MRDGPGKTLLPDTLQKLYAATQAPNTCTRRFISQGLEANFIIYTLFTNVSVSFRSPSAVFKYIGDWLDDSRTGAPAKAALQRAALAAMLGLVSADACAAAGLVLARFPGKHSAVIAQLGATPEKQYEYLKVNTIQTQGFLGLKRFTIR